MANVRGRKMNDQRSVTDQLWSLVDLANKNGHYDAADWLKNRLQDHDVESHQERHKFLHKCLDELVADWIQQNVNAYPSRNVVLDLMEWSKKQTEKPTGVYVKGR